MALTTNTLHSLFSDTVFFFKNFHLRLAIADSVDKQLNISRQASTTTISWDLALKFNISRHSDFSSCMMPLYQVSQK